MNLRRKIVQYLFIILDIFFIETSALSGDGVEEIFLQCARDILQKINDGVIDVTNSAYGVQVRETPALSAPQQTNNSSCC